MMENTTNVASPATGERPLYQTTAAEVWDRYTHVNTRGHRDYTYLAQLCERMYLGGGRQWDEKEASKLRAQGREPYEFNEILPSINAAIGHQINNRMDIAFRPRGGNADQVKADIRAKVTMQIADQCHLRWKETEVFSDGLIQQRGYYDVRMNFENNISGDVEVEVLDTLDVIPDPDAKTYEPKGWSDVLITRWLTESEIAQRWGKAKAAEVFASRPDDSDWGEYDDSGAMRPKFSDPVKRSQFYDAFYGQGSIIRARIIERQRWFDQMSRVLFYPRSGDRKLAETMQPDVIKQQIEQGAVMTKAMQRRVRWSVASNNVLVHDEWSPYNSFTVIPYFAYFRRGQTIGLVDNAVGPQRAKNKAMSQFIHVVNTTANSGWITEENSLRNMTDRELEQKGAMTGLHLSVAKQAKWPEKIQPNPIPQGLDRLVDLATTSLKSVTVPDAMRGQDGAETSGLARQTQQFAAQQQIALPLDNLARTRHLLGEKLHELEQQFYTDERTFIITETDLRTGKAVETPITINQYDPEAGAFINDMTEGDYDVVITEQPASVTFEDSQFRQALEMRKEGVALPDSVLVQSSSLSRKREILEEMTANAGKTDPLTEAKVALIQAQIQKTVADAVQSAVTAMFSSTQAANQIAAVPQVAPLADQLLRSAGFKDQDAAPIVPSLPPGAVPALPAPDIEANTSPNFPARPAQPDEGAAAGIERMDIAAGVPQ
jgi:hypothetical protein